MKKKSVKIKKPIKVINVVPKIVREQDQKARKRQQSNATAFGIGVG